MKKNPYIEDYGFSQRDFKRRKNLICFLQSICGQFLYEADKLVPLAEYFSRMADDEKRRYAEAVTAISVWLQNMCDLAYGEADLEETNDKNEYGAVEAMKYKEYGENIISEKPMNNDNNYHVGDKNKDEQKEVTQND